MTMHLTEQIITIAVVVVGTMLTRFLPFIVFSSGRDTPQYVQYLGMFLPSAVIGLLVIYCFKDVSLLSGSHGIPEFISVAVVALFHIWKRNMLFSIAGGTISYMILIQIFFNPFY